ncbi:uncharacterized protein LOC111383539 isoform X3 [Olea europaea var. sylvestris]|uniref:uncharacterized protein LOC111383539 isoform X3 n=1 Tax=Olea europaea var. sylvestris TaxID=158386 RepID=UPI000C1CCCE0|nr:uncharacterized protein LOC111383539 isoform X3 [Olea europaea var. sylvestris]
MVPPASLFFSSIDTISGSQIPIYQIMITSVSNYTSMSSLVPIGCHCYGGTQVMKNSSSFLSPLKCPMDLQFFGLLLDYCIKKDLQLLRAMTVGVSST